MPILLELQNLRLLRSKMTATKACQRNADIIYVKASYKNKIYLYNFVLKLWIIAYYLNYSKHKNIGLDIMFI